MPKLKVPAGVNHGWAVFILPYIEQQNLAAVYRFDRDWQDTLNAPVYESFVPTFICPSVPAGRRTVSGTFNGRSFKAAVGDYAVNNAINDALRDSGGSGLIDNIGPAGSSAYYGVMRGNRVVKITQITDGASNTLVIAEDAGRPQRYFRNQMSTATVSGRDKPVCAPWMVRTGASSPFAPPRKITMAAASGLGAKISSWVVS